MAVSTVLAPPDRIAFPADERSRDIGCANVRVVPTCKRACNVNVTDDDEEKEEEEEEDEEAVRDVCGACGARRTSA